MNVPHPYLDGLPVVPGHPPPVAITVHATVEVKTRSRSSPVTATLCKDLQKALLFWAQRSVLFALCIPFLRRHLRLKVLPTPAPPEVRLDVSRDGTASRALNMGIIESRLMMQGVLTEDGWAALTGKGGRNAKDIWLGMEETLQAIVLAAEDKVPERFGPDKRTANFECRYNGEAYFEAGDPPRISIDGFTILRKAGPRGTQPGSATDKRVYGLCDRRRGRVYAADLGITMHWDPNMDERTRMQNYHSTVAAASFILYNDRRRAFHISITIENTWARLWFHSRSHTICSISFDINSSYTDFIHFVLFAAYAEPKQIGFDPSVTRVVDADGSPQYQFRIQHTGEDVQRTYQTIGVLHEAAATAQLHHRSMAVYLVRPAVEGDGLSIVSDVTASRVLRDFFQRFDQPNELAARNHILAKMKRKARNAKEVAICESFFVSVLADGDVAFDLCWCSPYPDRQLDIVPRNRRRTLYGEVCQDLYCVRSPRLYFFAMGEASKILAFMLRAETVHRDISPGNFLLHARPGRLALPTSEDLSACYSVKITDFEYSKDYSEIAPEDLRTGTDFYMAVEVQAGSHLFYDDDEPDTLLAANHFSYNFYHDGESLLWMALDFALGYVSVKVLEDTDPETMSKWLWWQTQYRNLIFVNERGSQEREDLMMGSRLELARVDMILKRAHGEGSSMLKLVDLFLAMGDAHRSVQMEEEDPDAIANPDSVDIPFKQLSVESFDGAIYCEMQEMFLQISESFSGEDDEVVSLTSLLDRMDRPADPYWMWEELDVVLPDDVEGDDDLESLHDVVSDADSEELTEGALLRIIVQDVDDSEDSDDDLGGPVESPSPPAATPNMEVSTGASPQMLDTAALVVDVHRRLAALSVADQPQENTPSPLGVKPSRSTLGLRAEEVREDKENQPASLSNVNDNEALPPRRRTKSGSRSPRC
ncbi:uncharacterized protein SCHCODRAFT_02739614 [Schizophyllum commune H4-8]|nr:uncharacterized protein SCHCODRAFT_02739614 [Schizophyllum commune H4-8]KAI5889544.1 hypothetical protein SCHCODRAFT_02739614 [Schizophyllum commune H4-8]